MFTVVVCDIYLIYCAGHSIFSQHQSSSTNGDYDVQSPVRKRRKLCEDGCFDREVSDDHILKIYPQLEKWRRVAAHLGLTRADIGAIESEARPDEQLMRLYMLQEWKRKTKLQKTATYQVLLKALIDCECSESVVQVHKLLNQDGLEYTNGIASQHGVTASL